MRARIAYVSPSFSPKLIAGRYAAFVGGEYRIYEVNAKQATIRELVVARKDLPAGIADECDKWKNQVWNKVRMEK